MKLKNVYIYQKVMTESLTNYPSKLCHEPNPSRVPRKPHVIGYHAQSTWTLKCDSIACEKYLHPKRHQAHRGASVG